MEEDWEVMILSQPRSIILVLVGTPRRLCTRGAWHPEAAVDACWPRHVCATGTAAWRIGGIAKNLELPMK